MSQRDCFYEASNVSKKNGTCKIGGSHGGVVDDTSILGSEAVSLGGKLPSFEKIVMPSSSESGTARKICGLFSPEDDGARVHRNLENYFPNDTKSRPRRHVILKKSSFPKDRTVPLIFIKYLQWGF